MSGRRQIILISLIILGAILWVFLTPKEIEHEPGILVNKIPDQLPLTEPFRTEINEYKIDALAEYNIEGRVLSIRNYSSGQESDISPCDIALGWGKMSDSEILNRIKISQFSRFYFWETDFLPLPKDEIELKSANIHIIPADDFIIEKLKSIVKGNLIQMKGYLVEVYGPEKFHWKSSLRRDDTGQGACEILYVQSLFIL